MTPKVKSSNPLTGEIIYDFTEEELKEIVLTVLKVKDVMLSALCVRNDFTIVKAVQDGRGNVKIWCVLNTLFPFDVEANIGGTV